MKVSNATIAKFKKVYKIKSLDHLTVDQYKLLLQIEGEKKENIVDTIQYSYRAKYIAQDTIEVSLLGKHLSRNVINTLGRKDLLRLKKKIKDSARIFFLQNNKFSRPKWGKVKIDYVIYLKKMRDNDNTDLKTFQDTFVIHSLIKDDKNDVIIEKPKETQIVSDTYKIIATIKKV